LGLLAALLALSLLGTLVWAVRWQALLSLADVKLRALQVWRITLESQAGGVLLPGGIGGDALRVGFVVGKGASVPTALATVALDRAIGLVTVAGLAAGMAATGAGGALRQLVILLAAIPVAFVVGVVVLRWVPLAKAPFLARGALGRVVRPILGYIGDSRAPGAIALALGISLAVSAIQFGVIRGLVLALGTVPTSERWIYVGTTMAFVVGAIPGLPGGWGTSDAAFVFFLGKAGLPASSALAVSLLYRLFWYVSAGLGAGLYLQRQYAPPDSNASQPAPPPLV
jgi:uncharacterized membrane protein YbhN (UPF0104 family)